VSGSYLWKLADLQTVRGEAIYLGGQLQTGEIANWVVDDQVLSEPVMKPIYGGSVYLVGRTPVGPLTLGLGGTSTNAWSVWLTVGRPIGQGTILERGIFR
jgi:hypothetical protein